MKRSSGMSRDAKTALVLTSVVIGMIGLSFASVPLYDLFCRVTGYGGTTQRAGGDSEQVIDRTFVVRFDANTALDMPWQFHPAQRAVTVKAGQTALAFYEAYNPTDERVTGTATFNVTPLKVGQYFNKIQCFCFTEQTLEPGERVEMPVTFFVDPAIDEDENAHEVKTITLSYTFFPQEDVVADSTAALGEDAGASQGASGSRTR